MKKSHGKTQTGTWRQKVEQDHGKNLFTILLYGSVRSLFHYNLGPSTWGGTTHSGMHPPTSNHDLENSLTGFLPGQSHEGFFKAEDPSSRVTPAYVMLTKKHTNTKKNKQKKISSTTNLCDRTRIERYSHLL